MDYLLVYIASTMRLEAMGMELGDSNLERMTLRR